MKKWYVLFATLVLSSAVFAEGPCQADMAKFCSGVAKGRSMVRCLTENSKDLSSQCKDKYRDMKARMRHTYEACQDDAEKFCGDVKPGAGALPKCLKANEAQLSKGCKDAMLNKTRMRK
ncbi:MAG: cysteine rich repeat-containing protein [Pseudobdellovibrionaceae bacterium]